MSFKEFLLVALPLLVIFTIKESYGLVATQVTITNRRGNFETAQAACAAQGMKLISIESEADNNLVWGMTQAQSVGRFWIDGNNKAGGQWVNTNNQPLNFFRWSRGEPNNNGGNEHCIDIGNFNNQFWNDESCSSELGIVCRNNEVNLLAGVSSDNIGFELVAQSVRLNYAEAINHCKNLNMELVRVDSDTMNKIVFVFAVNKNLGTYWIDVNDIANEGYWVNSDGVSVPFRNWAQGEPNGGRSENCVHGLFYKDPLWNDTSCSSGNAVICLRVTGRIVASN